MTQRRTPQGVPSGGQFATMSRGEGASLDQAASPAPRGFGGMNEMDIEDALTQFGSGNTPNLRDGAHALANLCTWTNNNSDGWPYWQKPLRASKHLQELLTGADRFHPQDCSADEIRKACVPIKSFLTRQGVDHTVVFGTE